MARPHNGTLKGLTVSSSELAALFGVTLKTLSHWHRTEGLPRLSRGTWDVVACTQWFLVRVARKGSPVESDLARERRLLIVAQRKAQANENDQARAELFPADEVRAAVTAIVGVITSELDALPGRAMRTSIKPNPVEMQAALFAECRETRRRIADAMRGLVQSGG